MTFHAPQSNTGLISIVARRVLFSRATIVAAAVVTTSVVLAARGVDAPSVTQATEGKVLARASLYNTVAKEPRRAASLTVHAVPDLLRLPRDFDRKITAQIYDDKLDTPSAQAPSQPVLASIPDVRLDDVETRADGGKPAKPSPKDIRVASLSPANRDWGQLDASLSPRYPELGPVPITPSAALPDDDVTPPLDKLEARPVILTLSAETGETLELMLGRADLTDEDFRATLVALRADDITQSLIEGDMIDLALLAEDDRQLLALRVRQLGQPPIELRWDSDTKPLWASVDLGDIVDDPIETTALMESETLLSVTGKPDDTSYVSGVINSSLYASAAKVGLTAGETKALTDIFRYSVDFERDLRKGDRFEALFEKGKNGSFGDILFAKLTNRGSEIALYRAVDDLTGEVGYFDATGKTNKRSLMRTPLAGARISSHFGMRHHPVLGYTKMHRGTDFSAQRGTPIFAAGDGIVEYLGRNGAYGKYIRIQHNSVYETAYAHMSRYGAGLKSGDRVRQGDVIGYVGSTGRSTGPHLHFEILEHGNRINPMNIADFGPTRGLSGSALTAFLVRVSRIEIALTLKRNGSRIATAE